MVSEVLAKIPEGLAEIAGASDLSGSKGDVKWDLPEASGDVKWDSKLPDASGDVKWNQDAPNQEDITPWEKLIAETPDIILENGKIVIRDPKTGTDVPGSDSRHAPEEVSEALTDIKCKNGDLAGKKHPETDVPFEKKIIIVEGEEVEVVVPVFDSAFDAKLPEDKYKATDAEQNKECNSQLKEAITQDEELKSKFDETQLEQIENGETPDGYTWHHDAETGKMQLVDSDTHAKTGHTGGKAIWGGGSENR